MKNFSKGSIVEILLRDAGKVSTLFFRSQDYDVYILHGILLNYYKVIYHVLFLKRVISQSR